MKFEEIVVQLNARGVLLDHLGQIEDAQLWSVNVRKKGSTNQGYGIGVTIEEAVRKALSNTRDRFDSSPRVKKRKRVRL